MQHPPEPSSPSAVAPRRGEPLLDNQLAVVTGAGGGIGRGIARSLSFHGARVMIADISEQGGRETVELIASDGSPGAHALVVDVTTAAGVDQLGEQLSRLTTEPPQILVNNVGDFRPTGAFATIEEDGWTKIYRNNLEHVFRVTHRFLPQMIDARCGSIINVSSVEALRGIPNNAVYAACKAGVMNFTKSLAVEVANAGVRVNGIAPDATHTDQIPIYDWIKPQYAEDIGKWSPLGRFARPDDHGDVAVFLASEFARFVTGHTIPVDGGTMAAPGWYRRNATEFTNQPRGLR